MKLSRRRPDMLTLRDGRGRRRTANLGVRRTTHGPLSERSTKTRDARALLFAGNGLLGAAA